MTTIFLAQAIGVLFIIVGLSLITERKMVTGIFKELFQHRVLTYIWGILMLVISLVMILEHNIWSGTTALAVTILGWYLFLESLIYIFLPQKLFKVFYKLIQNKAIYYSLSVVFFVVGGYFLLAGFN